MENSKIFSLIKCLNKAQLRKFQEYVQSPFFNKHVQISILADTLITAARKGSTRLDTAQLYQKLYLNFGKRKFSMQLLDEYMKY